MLLPINITYSQINELEWKKVTVVKENDLDNLFRFEKSNSPTIKEFMGIIFESSSGKCVVTFKDCKINNVLNSPDGYNIPDSVSTPFFIYYQAGLNEQPEAGSWDEQIFSSVVSGTDKPSGVNWHTIVITGLLPIGFQIFFEDNHFKSRMFLGIGTEKPTFITPLEENLVISKTDKYERGNLLANFDLSKVPSLSDSFIGEKLGEITVGIEYEIVTEGH